MKILPCGLKIDTFKIRMRKRVHINYTDISPGFIFFLRYQHQVLNLMRLGTVWILLHYWLTWVDEPWNTSIKISLPKTKFLWHGVNFVISYLQYIIVLYKVQSRKYYRWHGVNKYIPSVRYLFIRKSTLKIQIHKNICWNGDKFQNNSQWACSVATFLLTGHWDNYTPNSQIAHSLIQYIAIKKSILNINYISYVNFWAFN